MVIWGMIALLTFWAKVFTKLLIWLAIAKLAFKTVPWELLIINADPWISPICAVAPNIVQNEKESILKLKESTNNPLLLLKDRTIENSDDSDSSSDNSDGNIRRKHNSIDGGSAAGGFGLVPIDNEGTIGVGRSG